MNANSFYTEQDLDTFIETGRLRASGCVLPQSNRIDTEEIPEIILTLDDEIVMDDTAADYDEHADTVITLNFEDRVTEIAVCPA